MASSPQSTAREAGGPLRVALPLHLAASATAHFCTREASCRVLGTVLGAPGVDWFLTQGAHEAKHNDGVAKRDASGEPDKRLLIELTGDDVPRALRSVVFENELPNRWQYLDPQGSVQGPFDMDRLIRWRERSFFGPELAVCSEKHGVWMPLHLAEAIAKPASGAVSQCAPSKASSGDAQTAHVHPESSDVEMTEVELGVLEELAQARSSGELSADALAAAQCELQLPVPMEIDTAPRRLLFVVDTNVLLSNLSLVTTIASGRPAEENLSDAPAVSVIVPWTALQELDRLKTESGVGGSCDTRKREVSALARAAIRTLSDSMTHGAGHASNGASGIFGQSMADYAAAERIVGGSVARATTNDDRILQCAVYMRLRGARAALEAQLMGGHAHQVAVLLVTNDRALSLKCTVNNVASAPASVLQQAVDTMPWSQTMETLFRAAVATSSANSSVSGKSSDVTGTCDTSVWAAGAPAAHNALGGAGAVGNMAQDVMGMFGALPTSAGLGGAGGAQQQLSADFAGHLGGAQAAMFGVGGGGNGHGAAGVPHGMQHAGGQQGFGFDAFALPQAQAGAQAPEMSPAGAGPGTEAAHKYLMSLLTQGVDSGLLASLDAQQQQAIVAALSAAGMSQPARQQQRAAAPAGSQWMASAAPGASLPPTSAAGALGMSGLGLGAGGDAQVQIEQHRQQLQAMARQAALSVPHTAQAPVGAADLMQQCMYVLGRALAPVIKHASARLVSPEWKDLLIAKNPGRWDGPKAINVMNKQWMPVFRDLLPRHGEMLLRSLQDRAHSLRRGNRTYLSKAHVHQTVSEAIELVSMLQPVLQGVPSPDASPEHVAIVQDLRLAEAMGNAVAELRVLLAQCAEN
ncbi:unnamed protein product [Pedinophyceae sp. YPF-701]|nr:unnamed protein product [Pedinophyceae sp. YPF-701]